MRVLNFGSCNIDYVYNVPHFVRAGETIGAGGMERFVGGKGLNQSIALARSGVSVYHAGYIGKDGAFLRDFLAENGVDVTYLRTVDAPTGHAIIQVDEKGENCIIIHSGANHCIDSAFVDTVLADFSAGDVLVLQNEISELPYIIDTAHKKGMTIVLTPAPCEESLTRLDLNKITVLALNAVEAFEFSGKNTPDEIGEYFRARYPHLQVMLTLGSHGSIYFGPDGAKPMECPAFSVTARDTTSAGDTFAGYFVAGLIAGRDMKKTLTMATAASALAVSRMGASASIPLRAEVEEALTWLKAKPRRENAVEQQKKRVEAYIEAHLADAALEELAAEMGYSKPYAATWIKNHMQVSFTKLLQQARCDEAARLLRETELPVEDIIKITGYENGSFFRKLFLEATGKAPLEYRRFHQRGAH